MNTNFFYGCGHVHWIHTIITGEGVDMAAYEERTPRFDDPSKGKR